MFCPDTESKLCIFGECPSYEAAISIHQCLICKETYQLGESCSQIGHKRSGAFLKNPPGYCQKYKTKVKD